MPQLSTADALIAAKEHAQNSWYLFAKERNLKAIVPDWRVTDSADGASALSVQVVGPGTAHALRLFTAASHFALGTAGDVRPQFDYSVPGRVACVMRLYGVWVELWHPDQPDTPAPKPAPVSARPVFGPRRLLRPGGRLPFTRRNKTPKENTTR